MNTTETLDYLPEPDEQGFNLSDIIDIAKRRKWHFVITSALVFVISALVALLLPPVYRSSATILIEKQDITPELIQTSVASYAEQQIQEVTQRVTTRTNLWRIIDKFNLYPEDRKRKTRQEVIEEMREDIGIDFINAELSDPHGGNRPVQVMIAFTLSFKYDDPKITQQVASDLTSLFMEENARARTETANEAVQFLNEESRRIKQQMEDLQGKLAKFKEGNLERLPEMNNIYQEELHQIENQLLQLQAQERSAKDKIFYLQGQLAQIDPHAMAVTPEGKRVLDIHDRLKALRSEYPSLLAKYSATHPDVIRVKNEIEALEKQESGIAPDLQGMNAQLRQKQAELVGLRKRYSPKYPDVIKLQREIDQLRLQIEEAGKSQRSNAGKAMEPDNPAYITLQAQLESARSELRSLKGTRLGLEKRRRDIRGNLAASPLVEKEYRTLEEELDATVQRYRDLRARQLSAKVSQQFEVERKGEHLTLIDPPQMPEKPESPKRPLIVLLGLILGCGAGTASAVLAEAVDQSVHDEQAVATATGLAPLVSIPYLELPEESQRKRNYRWILLGGMVLAVITLTALVHFLVSPLDVLWFRILNKLNMGMGG